MRIAPLTKNLIEARLKAGYTQEKLADELNLSRSFIAALEIGKRRPSAITAKRISEFFGYEFDNLFIVEDK